MNKKMRNFGIFFRRSERYICSQDYADRCEWQRAGFLAARVPRHCAGQRNRLCADRSGPSDGRGLGTFQHRLLSNFLGQRRKSVPHRPQYRRVILAGANHVATSESSVRFKRVRDWQRRSEVHAGGASFYYYCKFHSIRTVPVCLQCFGGCTFEYAAGKSQD